MALLILGEASPEIGTGHVVECFNLTRAAQHRDVETTLLVNEDCPERLLGNSPIPASLVRDFAPRTLERIADRAIGKSKTCVTNFRKLNNEQVCALRRGFSCVAAIDEFGQRRLETDLIFNNTIVPEFHEYFARDGFPRVFTGPAYLAMDENYACLHRKARAFSEGLRRIVITLGGTDRSQATARILSALLDWRNPLQIDVVLGSGFFDGENLTAALRKSHRHKVRCHHSLPSIAELLAKADVAFTSGGNTLYELACVGTPSVTVYDDPHERRQSEILAEQGFGFCLCQGQEMKPEMITGALERLQPGEQRRRQSEIGRGLVDGRGAERIVEILLSV